MAETRTIWRGARWLAIGLAAGLMALAMIGLRSELASAGPAASASATKTVDIEGFAYHPPTLTISKGTTVNFTNSSRTAHTATRSGSFTTGRIKPGKTIGIRFNSKGTFAYHCTIHPFMKGKIVVK